MMNGLTVRTHEQLSAAGVLHPTGIAAPLTLEEAKLLVPYVATVTSAARWWRADLAAMLGEEYYDEIANLTGCTSSTVRQDVATANKWPMEARVNGISFNHHRALNIFVDRIGIESVHDILQVAADTVPTPSPEVLRIQVLNTVSEYHSSWDEYKYQPRYDKFAEWLKDVTGLEVEASNSVVVIATNAGSWRGVATLAGDRPVIDWRFEQEGE